MPQPSSLLSALAGAALVAAAWAFTNGSAVEPPPPQAFPGARTSLADSADARAVLERLDRIERRLATLTPGAPGVASEGPDAANGAPTLQGVRPTGAADAGASTGDGAASNVSSEALISDEVLERTLERTLERIEEKRLEVYSNKDLRAQAQRLLDKGGDPLGARRLYEHLLARDLEPLERVEVLTERGAAERSVGDIAASEQSLRDAMRLGGTDTEQGVAAGYQLAWTLARGQRNEEALRVADGLLGARGLGEMMRQNVRWAGARLASMTGDTRRARADYQALVDELSGQAQYASIVKDATAQLAGLDK